jgi:hypothetical protein
VGKRGANPSRQGESMRIVQSLFDDLSLFPAAKRDVIIAQDNKKDNILLQFEHIDDLIAALQEFKRIRS